MPTPDQPFLLPLGATDTATMRSRLRELASELNGAEADGAGLAGLAARLDRELPAGPRLRCAIVASSAAEALDAVADAERALDGAGPAHSGRAFLGRGALPRIGLLFPGQGAPAVSSIGALAERVPAAASAFAEAGLPEGAGALPDELVQLSVVASSLAGIELLAALGLEADVALGHSLGELTALHWAGAIDRAALLRIARARGAAMTSHAASRGTMATVRAERAELEQLIRGAPLTVACHNSPRQWAVSGEVEAVEALLGRAREAGVRAKRLRVIGAFHSPLMEPALPAFRRSLEGERFAPLRRPLVSTVTGAALAADADAPALLLDQIVSPVRFAEAVAVAVADVGLLIEVGPGRILSPLVREIAEVPVIATRVGAGSPRALAETAAALFAVGAPGAVGRLLPAPVERVGL